MGKEECAGTCLGPNEEGQNRAFLRGQCDESIIQNCHVPQHSDPWGSWAAGWELGGFPRMLLDTRHQIPCKGFSEITGRDSTEASGQKSYFSNLIKSVRV